MFCKNCGNSLKEDSNFCGKCGQKVTATVEDINCTEQTAPDNTRYTMYEVFNFPESSILKAGSSVFWGLSNAMAKVLYHNHPKALANYEDFRDNPTYRSIRSYIITDRSIIFEGVEHFYKDMMIFSPKNVLVTFIINDITYSLISSLEETHKVYYALFRANSSFPLLFPRTKLKYANMAYHFLKQIKWVYRKVPYITYDGNIVFNELWETYQMKLIDKTGEATYEQKLWIDRYNQVAQQLDDFFKNERPISNNGFNREPETLEKIIDMMSDLETDMNAVVLRYNRKLQMDDIAQQERIERKAMEREMNRSNGGGFAGRTLSTAAGVVIGNKLSNSSKPKREEQHFYSCLLSCPYEYRVCGVPKCRLQPNNMTPDPSKCGHGHLIR